MICNVLYIDLSTGAAEEKKFDAGLWLGGRGMATKLFYDEVDPKCDPLGPDNVMVIAMSPLSGTPAPTAGRTHTVFKSPLTGAIGSSNTGGRWGKIFKSSGYDALVIKGAAKSPVYLTVSDKG